MENPDHQSTLQQVDELEKKVERLISVFALQAEALLELKKKNEGLEEELRKRIESDKRHEDERTTIRSKVDSLLAKLENTNIANVT